MNTAKKIVFSLLVLFNSAMFSGCWNYREIEQLVVVAGVAIDKGTHENFSITLETVEVAADKVTGHKSRIATVEGKTIFDAARHQISVLGKKPYWSHAKVVIISREVAEAGVVEVLDWFNRDAETRGDIHIFVSREKTAKEILTTKGLTEEATAFLLDDMLINEKFLSDAPHVEIWRFTNTMTAKGVGSIAAAIDLKQVGGEKKPHIMGTAIFKHDKFLDFIDGDETKDMLFVQNNIKGGVLSVEVNINNSDLMVSLEILKNKTKIEPVINNGEIEMNVKVETITAIDEIAGTQDIIEDENRKRLEETAEKMLKNSIEKTIKKVQMEFGVDIFGFGVKLREKKPKVWNTVADNWADTFKALKVNVETKVHVKNSAMLSKTLEVGD